MISIVIPAFKAHETIVRAAQSCSTLSQLHQVYVVIDGPDPETQNAVAGIDKVCVVVNEKNVGPGASRNVGLNLVKSEYVIFLDADDDLIAKNINDEYPQISEEGSDIVFGGVGYEQNGTIYEFKEPSKMFVAVAERIFCQWLLGSFVPPCGIIWRTEFLRVIGGWDSELTRNEDGDVVLRGLLNTPRIFISRRIFGSYVQHDSPFRVSKRSSIRAFQSELRILERLSNLAHASSFQDINSALAFAYYGVARSSYQSGYGELGDMALRRARELGYGGHYGSTFHRLLSGLVGLSAKERMSSGLRALVRGS